ncbi:hypothetical protein X731_03775 [Mesorhizobium sp. L2C054A000]|nr:DUF6119 family protein [Mesorhizobium sp. L2C054A000]ESZ51707.1 hypothetical protein X731_03775 [Mesorhizobium sp. L2C054A000]
MPSIDVKDDGQIVPSGSAVLKKDCPRWGELGRPDGEKPQKSIRKLIIRLLRNGIEPNDAVRPGVALVPFAQFKDSKIALGSSGGETPTWASFLNLGADEKAKLKNSGAYGLLFLKSAERWFAIAFGGGFQKISPTSFEHDFGLRVVINAVDAKKLRSADIRTPDENTTTTRTQASRHSPQEVFEINHERDLVRGLEGTPRDASFASRVSGSDALVIWKRADLSDLPTVCSDALSVYGKDDYKDNFKWIDDIRHERDTAVIGTLDGLLTAAVNAAIVDDRSESLHLAWPVIYNAESSNWVQYGGFRSTQIFDDLDIRNYLQELSAKGITNLTADQLSKHYVAQTDEDGRRSGDDFPLRDCFVFETEHEGRKYVLSGGRWYEIDRNLAAQVLAFFNKVDAFVLPPPAGAENESEYNERLEREKSSEWVCFDTKLVTPTDARTPIEVCDFLISPRVFIHVKDQAASSKLSHLL